MKEQTLKVNCDYCGNVLSYNEIKKEYEHIIDGTVLDFCNDKCKDFYDYEHNRVPLFYHEHITSRADREPEFFIWNNEVYYDYPYQHQDSEPSKILKVFRINDRYNGDDAVNSLLFILRDLKYGRVWCKGVHQYVNTTSNKESVYDSRHDIDARLLLDLLEMVDDLNYLSIYLKDFPVL